MSDFETGLITLIAVIIGWGIGEIINELRFRRNLKQWEPEKKPNAQPC